MNKSFVLKLVSDIALKQMKKPLLQIHTKYFINVLNFLKFLFNCNFQKRPFSASIMSLLKLFQITYHAQNREINKGENLNVCNIFLDISNILHFHFKE